MMNQLDLTSGKGGVDMNCAAQLRGLAIAGNSDGILNSAVFIQANSFSDIPTPTIPVPAAVWLFGSGLVGLLVFSRRQAANN